MNRIAAESGRPASHRKGLAGSPPESTRGLRRQVVALVGHPNVGKTSLFNRLTRSMAKTSNFSGTTVEVSSAAMAMGDTPFTVVDLPGLYSLEAATPEEQITAGYLRGELSRFAAPDQLIAVVDACNLERTLFLISQLQPLEIPMFVAVNMVDAAVAGGVEVDFEALRAQLPFELIPVSARTGEGIEALRRALGDSVDPLSPSEDVCARTGDVSVGDIVELSTSTAGSSAASPADGASECGLDVMTGAESTDCTSCHSCVFAAGYQWSAGISSSAIRPSSTSRDGDRRSDAIDRWLTSGGMGMIVFAATMFIVFSSIFWVAQFPMELMDTAVSELARWSSNALPKGLLTDFLTDGVIAGIGSVLVFLPQICVLFFLLALLDDCGYLPRAVVVVDRWMRRFGLPGQAFVPILAANACAIPAIMSTRVISSRRDRLAAIMVIPLMTCSARLPVYSMVAAMLFPSRPLQAGLLFVAAYALGIVAAMLTASLLQVSLLPGKPAPLLIDLPAYRVPSFSKAIRESLYRGWAFVQGAGTVILAISVTIWVLSTFPRLNDESYRSMAAARVAVSSDESSAVNHNEIVGILDGGESAGEGANRVEQGATGSVVPDDDRLRQQLAQEYSLLGRAGKWVQPVFEPLGFDWRTSVGVLASFAAREVVVSTMSILYGAGDDADSMIDRIRHAKRPDGRPALGTSSAISLLVFFVLAMQCMPTQAVTRKETGSWKWAGLQLGYMTVLAYAGAFIAKSACDIVSNWI